MKKNQDFTTEDIERIMSTDRTSDGALAKEWGITRASVSAMRRHLQDQAPKVLAAARMPAAKTRKVVEDENILVIQFGESTMMLNKEDVSMIRITPAGITIAR